MATTFARRHMSAVAELVDDPRELESRAGEPVARVVLSFSDGTQVEVSERGRELVEFILRALNSGLEVNVEAEEELLTPGAAAEVLGVARQSVYRWQDAGLLPMVMRGRARAVPAVAVRELKAARDSRELADSVAVEARSMSQADSDAAMQSAGLFTELQSVRAGRLAQAGQLWRVARAAQIAQQGQHARAVFADDVDR